MRQAILFALAALAAMSLQAQPVASPSRAPWTCSVTVTGDFDSECIYDYKDDITDEYPNLMVACKNSTVTYTAHATVGGAAPSGYIWEVYGAVSHSAAGSQAVVEWGDGMWGYLTVSATDGQGDTCSVFYRVRLIDKPEAASSSVPQAVVMSDGTRVIRVCKGGTVQFIDHSEAEGADITGHHWEFDDIAETSTPNFTIEDIRSGGTVVHRVTNNCGCYDEEYYKIVLLKGDELELECYGTACRDATVTYTATAPACSDYHWYVEGGTVVDGQGTPSLTVLWDDPTDGYGVIGLDGVLCGDLVCPAMMSRRVPVMQGALHIKGQTDVCLGEAAVYTLPLFGSAEYRWEVSPAAGVDTSMKGNANEVRLVFGQAGTYRLTCRYSCGFLGCGPYDADTLTLTVKPSLVIGGQEEICVSNACALTVTPAESVAWTAYDLGTDAVAATATGTTFSHTFSHAGRYLVTAEHPDYCSGASFLLTVKETPPAPTVADLDPANRHTACLYSSLALAGTPSQPQYSLVWEPQCASASPQSWTGDSVTVGFLDEVADVWVYNYDRVLQCRSADHLVHTVQEFEIADVDFPTAITACPGTVITWGDDNVPDQSAEGVLYRWTIEELLQRCASLQGSQFSNTATLTVHEGLTLPTTFTVTLDRKFCGNFHDYTVIPITVSNGGQPLTIQGPDTVCLYADAEFTGNGGNTSSYSWTVENRHLSGNPIVHSFENTGSYNVKLRGHSYIYCTNSDYYTTATKSVFARALPAVNGLVYDRNAGMLYVTPDMQNCTYEWWYKETYESPQIPMFGNSFLLVPTWPPMFGTFLCKVTDTITGCSKTVGYLMGEIPIENCDTMHFSASYDFCSSRLTLTANEHPSNVVWNLPPGCHAVGYSGYHNKTVEVEFSDVGNYTISASSGFDNCYKGTYHMTVGFMPDFSFEPQCDRIKIVNNSHHIPLAYTLYIRVTNDCNNQEDIIPMAESASAQTYVPSPQPADTCTYHFYLVGYGSNGNIAPCPLGSATIGTPAATPGMPPLYIETDNNADPDATCNNTPIRLTAHLGYDGSIVSSTWYFGDGSHFTTASDNICHTFEYPGSSPYNVTVTAVDNYGCTRTTAPFTITSHSNPLYTYTNNSIEPLTQLNGNKCPNEDPIYIEFFPQYVTNQYTWWRLKDPTLHPTGNIHIYSTYRTDDYFVHVIDINYCQAQAAKNVGFLNAPTARIYAKNDNLCAGESITLYGSAGGGNSYSWSVSGPGGYTAASTDPDYTFTAPTYASGVFTVTLTVTNNDNGCSDTDTKTLTVNARPTAPSLAVNGSPCISDAPVQIDASGFSGTMHWSNGQTGSSAFYYTHGLAAAYYYDPAIGCHSDTATLRIDREPDFDALLTGCYRKCSGFFDYLLPVWGLTDDSQEIGWEWSRDGGTVASGHGDYSHTPLLLPLTGHGSYTLDVQYGGGNCHATSPQLTIGGKEECDCDSIEVTYKRKQTIEGCLLLYDIQVTLCNRRHDRTFCANGLEPLLHHSNTDITSTDFTPTAIPPGGCYTFNMQLDVHQLPPWAATFVITDRSCSNCELTFSVDLTPEVDCYEEMMLNEINIVAELSSSAAAYFGFACDASPADRVLAFWTEPPMVVDWLASGSSVSGIGVVETARLSQLLYDGSVICFHAITCHENVLCLRTVCIKAMDFYKLLIEAGEDPGIRKGMADNGTASGSATPRLKPNPATGAVEVDGATGTVTEVAVMDMNGRRIAVFAETATFSVEGLPSGAYIVRVRTAGEGEEKVTYHKLIKK